jgi:hypothetical protein
VMDPNDEIRLVEMIVAARAHQRIAASGNPDPETKEASGENGR